MHVFEPEADLHKPVQHCVLGQQLALALLQNAVQVAWPHNTSTSTSSNVQSTDPLTSSFTPLPPRWLHHALLLLLVKVCAAAGMQQQCSQTASCKQLLVQAAEILTVQQPCCSPSLHQSMTMHSLEPEVKHSLQRTMLGCFSASSSCRTVCDARKIDWNQLVIYRLLDYYIC